MLEESTNNNDSLMMNDDNKIREEYERIEIQRKRREAFLSNVSSIANAAEVELAKVDQNSIDFLSNVSSSVVDQVHSTSYSFISPKPSEFHIKLSNDENNVTSNVTNILSSHISPSISDWSAINEKDSNKISASTINDSGNKTYFDSTNHERNEFQSNLVFQSDSVRNHSRAVYSNTNNSAITESITPYPSNLDIQKISKNYIGKESGRAAWMAQQEDLIIKRKDLHGAVTYEFGGVFAWQMYGAADAIDAGGPYTEYIMRCQWGLDWNTLHPWMVTRRYREFEALDSKLRSDFPALQNTLPALPPKVTASLWTLSSALGLGLDPDPEIVNERQKALEAYLTKIVTVLPIALRSRHISEFLGLEDRIKFIRKNIQMEREKQLLLAEKEYEKVNNNSNSESNFHECEEETENTTSSKSNNNSSNHQSNKEASMVVSESSKRNSNRYSGKKVAFIKFDDVHTIPNLSPTSNTPKRSYGSNNSSSYNNNSTSDVIVLFAGDELLTIDRADELRVRQNAQPLNDQSLSHVKKEVNAFTQALQCLPPKDVDTDANVRIKLRNCMSFWPALRATASLEMEDDEEENMITGSGNFQAHPLANSSTRSSNSRSNLVVRALTIEEELRNAVDEIRSILIAQRLG